MQEWELLKQKGIPEKDHKSDPAENGYVEKVESEKGAPKGAVPQRFWVPQMGPGPPKVISVGGTVKAYSFFTILLFCGKVRFFEITSPKQKGLLRSQGRPNRPSTSEVGNMSLV